MDTDRTDRGGETSGSDGHDGASTGGSVGVAEALAAEFEGLMDAAEVDQLRQKQQSILRALNDSRLTLKEFNNFSAQTLGAVSADFAKHTKVIRSIKADLDYIFKHTRQLREKIKSKYPSAFEGIQERRHDAPEEDG